MNRSDFKLRDSQLQLLLANETDPLANASNFVVLRGDELVLGPFQGKPFI